MKLTRDMLITYIRDEMNIDDPLSGDTELFSSGLMDSVGMVGLIAFVEENGGMHVQPSDVTLENFDTVDAIVAYAQSVA